MRLLTAIAIALFISVLSGSTAFAQIYRAGAGLAFASGYQFNSLEVGNPGVKLKTWVALDRKSTIHIVPSITGFNKNVLDAGYYRLSNYMFMADLDGQYMTFKEGTLKVIVFAGGNLSYLVSTVAQTDPKYPIPEHAPGDQKEFVIGANLGAGLELRMGDHWDMNVSAKYILAKYSQFIISVEGVYYFKSRRRAYRRR